MIQDCARPSSSASTVGAAAIDAPNETGCAGAGGGELDHLPRPLSPATSDDLMTSLAMLSIQQRHEQRAAADQQRSVAAKAQEEANAEKISKMRELAEDTFMEGLASGLLSGAAAAASAGSACTGYAATTTKGTEQAAAMSRTSRLLTATSEGLNGASKFASASVKSDQENDRADIATADGAIERAKAAVDAATAEGRKADEDTRETINALRQYLAAKSQLANAAIIKG